MVIVAVDGVIVVVSVALVVAFLVLLVFLVKSFVAEIFAVEVEVATGF